MCRPQPVFTSGARCFSASPFDAMDKDGSGAISFMEFKLWWKERNGGKMDHAMLEEAGKAFHSLDDDGNGTLERPELELLLQRLLGGTPSQGPFAHSCGLRAYLTESADFLQVSKTPLWRPHTQNRPTARTGTLGHVMASVEIYPILKVCGVLL